MSTDRRLERLYPALTAKERARLILRAWKAGKEPDPKIRWTMPANQTCAYNQLIGLLCASENLTKFIAIVAQMLEELSLRWCWLASLHSAALDACALAESALASVPGQKEKRALVRALRPQMARFALSLYDDDPRWTETKDDDTSFVTGDRIAQMLIEGMRVTWPVRWRELRAAEILVDEIAQEFDGEDPLPVDARALLDHCRGDLCDLKKRIEPYTGELAQEEPGNELLERLRGMVHDA